MLRHFEAGREVSEFMFSVRSKKYEFFYEITMATDKSRKVYIFVSHSTMGLVRNGLHKG